MDLTFRAGQTIPVSGIYLVEHFRHRDAHEVTLLKGERFPHCQECAFGVNFTLEEAAPHLDDRRSQIVLHQIPENAEAA